MKLYSFIEVGFSENLRKKSISFLFIFYLNEKTCRRRWLTSCKTWYIKTHGPSAHTFLHGISTSRVKIIPVLKNVYLFYEVHNMKNRQLENNYRN